MKVLITGCSSDSYWYDKEIGKVHEVLPNNDENGDFVLASDEEAGLHPQDCHIIQSIATVLMEWEKNGGELEYWSPLFKRFGPVDTKEDSISFTDILRIKPVETPQYRPYTFEEAKEVFTKDGWVKSKVSGYLGLVTLIADDLVKVSENDQTYQELLEKATHLDGTPCGVKIN